MGTSWSDSADRALARVFADLPHSTDEATVRKLVSAAYPFGERRYWPYKVWLARAKAWRAAWKKGMKTPAPSARMHPAERHDHETGDLFA